MLNFEQLHPQYITNDAGKKVSVVLPLNEFHSLLEDLQDLVVIAERHDEPNVTHEALVKRLKKDRIIGNDEL